MGYKKVDGEIVLDDAEAAIVRKIYDYFLAGYGYTVIADRLAAEGVPTKKPGSMWASTTVRMILLNEKYCGKQSRKIGKRKNAECGKQIADYEYRHVSTSKTLDQASSHIDESAGHDKLADGELLEKKRAKEQDQGGKIRPRIPITLIFNISKTFLERKIIILPVFFDHPKGMEQK